LTRLGQKENEAVKKSRFSEEQIVVILRESEAGMATGELCRKHGIAQQTFYRWKSKYGGMSVSEAQRLKQLEEENRRLSLSLFQNGKVREEWQGLSNGPASRFHP
jgi:putative transposase